MRRPVHPEAVLFDLDGTLANTLPQLALAARQASEDTGIKPPSIEEARSYVGNGTNMLLSRCIAGRVKFAPGEVDPQLLKKVRAAYNIRYMQGLADNYQLYEGVPGVLDTLRQRGIRLAVVTNKPQMFADPLLKYMGLYSKFDLVLGGEVLETRKPDPGPLLYVLEKLGCRPEHSAMVGDSDNDMLAGKRAGMTCVFMTYGFYSGDPDALVLDYKFDSFLRLRDIFE